MWVLKSKSKNAEYRIFINLITQLFQEELNVEFLYEASKSAMRLFGLDEPDADDFFLEDMLEPCLNEDDDDGNQEVWMELNQSTNSDSSQTTISLASSSSSAPSSSKLLTTWKWEIKIEDVKFLDSKKQKSLHKKKRQIICKRKF